MQDPPSVKLTAAEAAALSEKKRTPRGTIVAAVLDCYYRAIRSAAARELRRVRHVEVDRIRTPVYESETQAAWQDLRGSGFKVNEHGVHW